MTMTIVAIHGIDRQHLARVMADMDRLGAPTIRAIEVAGVMYVLEGTHRLAAADRLGIIPVIDMVADGEAPEEQVITGLDLDDRDTWTVGELREYLADGNTDGRAIYKW